MRVDAFDRLRIQPFNPPLVVAWVPAASTGQADVDLAGDVYANSPVTPGVDLADAFPVVAFRPDRSISVLGLSGYYPPTNDL